MPYIDPAQPYRPRLTVWHRSVSNLSWHTHQVPHIAQFKTYTQWIWDRAAQLAEPGQKVWHVLDSWHACDHLGTISKVLYGEGSEQCKRSFKRWRRLLRKGCVAAVIKELHASGRYNKQQCYDLQGEINYFTANQQRMDYPLYRACGLPIAAESRVPARTWSPSA